MNKKVYQAKTKYSKISQMINLRMRDNFVIPGK